MKVKDLLKLLENIDPETVVLVPDFDHSYRSRIDCRIMLVEENCHDYYEYFNDDNMLDDKSTKVKALVIE